MLCVAACALLLPATAHAIINQVDGQIVPQTDALQSCLDKDSAPGPSNPAPGEGRGVLDAVRAAAITPQVFVPGQRRSDNRRVAQFTMVAEGAGYQNRFGWYNVGESPFSPGNRREIFACRERFAETGCSCPCQGGTRAAIPPNGLCTSWINGNIVEVDFDCMLTNRVWNGGPIAFYIMTPELIEGGSDGNCPDVNSSRNRVYSTDNSINDDGDYLHFLIYTSRTFPDGYYFGWEDLFRGGDNDFEDALVRAIGLIPTCVPAPEVCDGRDNNCNGMVDEGLGQLTCGLGACRRTVEACVGGRTQVCTPGNASAEICDNLDNNCNGMIDEGVTRACTTSCGTGMQYCTAGVWGDCVAPQPTPEVCDNRDNDCNGMVDDNLRRECRTACGTGAEVCTAGAWSACSAANPTAEVCNGLDDDCNGRIDDNIATRPCRTACGPGTERCVGGRFVCDARLPRPEICDNMDNDCNGMVDDNVPGGGSCGSNVGVCRAGTFVCRAGRYVCEGATAGTPERCDGLDNNCNGLVDVGNPGGGAACMTGTDGTALCRAGVLACRDGMIRCEGGTVGQREVCNCMDDDCDGMIDEDAAGSNPLCPGGRCLGCACRTPCAPGEFPCSAGLICNSENFCVPPLCGTEICRQDQVCQNNRCVDLCETVTCPAGRVCRIQSSQAVCVEDNCYGLGCPGAQLCIAGRCANNQCLATTCPAGQFCRPGANGAATCVRSCGDVQCPTGQACTDGRCRPNPCAFQTCGAGLICEVNAGAARCIPDPCLNVGTTPGRVCANGRLVDDPCAGVSCPGAPRVVCRAGQCIDPMLPPLVRDRIIPTGGCAATPARATSAWPLAALAALAFATRRRRRDGATAGGAR